MAPKNTPENITTPLLNPVDQKETALLSPSEFQIIKDKEGFKVQHGENIFPFATKKMESAVDFKHRLDILMQVQNTCKEIILLQKECKFYTDKADHTIGRKYQDLFIDSGILPILNRTTALTHERLEEIFNTNKTKNIVTELANFLNEIAAKKEQKQPLVPN